MNPLLEKFDTPFETVPFDKIKPEHYLPALNASIDLAKKRLEEIKNVDHPTFENTIEALEYFDSEISQISMIYYNQRSANNNDELKEIAQEFSEKTTAFYNDVSLDSALFEKVKSVHDHLDGLEAEKDEVLKKQYKSFVRNGALLDEVGKNILRDIDKEMSELKIKFGDNLLHETNDFLLLIDNEKDLSGLPDYAIEAASEIAKEKDHEGKWAFTLHYPSYIPFMTYADNRDLREKLFKAFASKCIKGNEFDNREILKKLANLRYKRAKLLGYESHAEYVLEERMARGANEVEKFLNELKEKARPVAFKEIDGLKEFAKSEGFIGEIMPWDYAYWSEKQKKSLFEINDEILKPYFKLENCIDGVFEVSSRLFDLEFKENSDIPKYNEDVKVYEVYKKSGDFVGIFYCDFFPHAGKRGGAWMTEYKSQFIRDGVDHRPHVSIVCNFSKPTGSKPSLFTLDEVLTLFHEFGHSLHGLLSKVTFPSISGTSVFWDFVELPSQILENWVFEKEALDLFARHYETNDPIPEELVKKIKDSSNFHEGRATLRQLSFALLDMSFHDGDPSGIDDVESHENKVTSETRLLPKVEGTCMAPSFSHIFDGGYSSGYYSYKWAEVLDADAFEAFKEKGLFDKETARKFEENILSQGGSAHPIDLYKRFRGREPKVDALLKRAGLA